MKACVLILAGLALGAHAQPVYRCGPDGSTYSQTPCPEGRRVEVDDARTPAQRAQAAQAVRSDAATAAALERQRQKESSLAPMRAANVGPERPRAAPQAAVVAKHRKRVKERAAIGSADAPVVVPPTSPAPPVKHRRGSK